MPKYRLTPEASRRVIQMFGGQEKMAKRLGLKQPSISRYSRVGFPHPYVLVIQSMLPEGLGKELIAPENLMPVGEQ